MERGLFTEIIPWLEHPMVIRLQRLWDLKRPEFSSFRVPRGQGFEALRL